MQTKQIILKSICCFFVLVALTVSVHAKPRSSVKLTALRVENPRGAQEALILPYAFSADSLGTTLGVGGMAKGYYQDQLLFGGTVFGSFDEAAAIILGMWDYRLPWAQRIFFTTFGSVGHYPRQRAYTDPVIQPGVIQPGVIPAGSNESDPDDYIESSGFDNWFEFKLEYVLPLGGARDDGMSTYKLKNGILQSGATCGNVWNPLTSGVTVLMLRQFNRYRSYDTDIGGQDYTIHPIEISLFYNNTDFPTNPSYGSSQYLSFTNDFGWLESTDSWSFIEFEASKYFSLGDSDWARQRVINLNFWTGDALTWEEIVDAHGNTVVTHRPPFYEGANLGGFYRMKAYPSSRFNDRSVIYTSAEYRYTLRWNPLGNISWLRFLKSDWLQLVGFAEGGRVANEYTVSELFSDWKIDGGFGIRAMMAGAVVRLDFAYSDEGSAAWVMFGQPF